LIFFFLLLQGLFVGFRYFVIIRMDFRKCEESMTVSTIFNKCSLKAWFYTRDTGKIDITT